MGTFNLWILLCKLILYSTFSGWSFGLGVVGAVACLVTAALFLTEANIQSKKRNKLKESQARFELEYESKA